MLRITSRTQNYTHSRQASEARSTASYCTVPMGLVTDICKCSLTHARTLTVQQKSRRTCKTLQHWNRYMRQTHTLLHCHALTEASARCFCFFLGGSESVFLPPIFTVTVTTHVDCNCIYLYRFISSWTSFTVYTHLQHQKPKTQGGSRLVERAEAANSVACSQSANTSVP